MRMPEIRPAYRDGAARQSHTYRPARREEQKARYRNMKRAKAAAVKQAKEQRDRLLGVA